MPNTGGSLKIWIAPSNVTITVYHRQGVSGIGYGYSIYYSYPACGSGGPSYTKLDCAGDCPSSDVCDVCTTFTVPQNVNVSIAVEDCGTVTGISFNAADNTSTCPSNDAIYCDDFGCYNPFIFNSGTVNKNIAITVYAFKFGYMSCA